MTGRLERWARGRWNVLRARRPRLAGTVESGLLGLRGTAHLVDEVRVLRTRVAELERDQALISAHVAALTEAAAPAGAGPDPSVEAVRLTAVAFYEHRIAALEARLNGLPHLKKRPSATTRVTGRGTADDGTENR